MKKVFLPETKLLLLKEKIKDPYSEGDGLVGSVGVEQGGGANDFFHFDDSKKAINQGKAMSENSEQEVEDDEINLSSFKKKRTLAPKIWINGDELNPKVRLRLLDIADDFWDYANISWVNPVGIILTGSICNYNWSKYSDIDLHLVVDFKKVDKKTDFVQEYFDAKKNEWNDEHDGLSIYGFPIELYVEDVAAKTTSGGLYDLEKNKWIRKANPNDIKSIGLDKFEIKHKAASIMTKIDDMEDELNVTDDKAITRKIGKKADSLLRKVKKMRKTGLERGGESDPLNIVYKVLRRTEYLDKLWDIKSTCYDKEQSISEGKEPVSLNEYFKVGPETNLLEYFRKYRTPEQKVLRLVELDPQFAWQFYYNEIIIGNSDGVDTYLNVPEKYAAKMPKTASDIYSKLAKEKERWPNILNCFITNYVLTHGREDSPFWMLASYEREVNNEWLIHFGKDASKIANEGFTRGEQDLDKLGYTHFHNIGNHPGYNFAFTVKDLNVDADRHVSSYKGGSLNTYYGDQAVIFQASGIRYFHLGDNDDEVVFWGPSAKNLIKIQLEEINPTDSIYDSITNNIEKFKKTRKFNKMSDDEKSDYEMNAVGKSFDYEDKIKVAKELDDDEKLKGDYWTVRSNVDGKILYYSKNIRKTIGWVITNMKQYSKLILN